MSDTFKDRFFIRNKQYKNDTFKRRERQQANLVCHFWLTFDEDDRFHFKKDEKRTLIDKQINWDIYYKYMYSLHYVNRILEKYANYDGGYPWDAVWTEIVEKTNHLDGVIKERIRKHVKENVSLINQLEYCSHRMDLPTTESWQRFDFYIDEAGILRQKTRKKYNRANSIGKKSYMDRLQAYGLGDKPSELTSIYNWIAKRVVIREDNKLYWYRAVLNITENEFDSKRIYAELKMTNTISPWYNGGISYLFSSLPNGVEKSYKYNRLKYNSIATAVPFNIKWFYKQYFAEAIVYMLDRPFNKNDYSYWNKIGEHTQSKILGKPSFVYIGK